jgi:hypothetical protein
MSSTSEGEKLGECQAEKAPPPPAPQTRAIVAHKDHPMPRQSYPLLDIKQALQDADRNLADVLVYVDILAHDSGGTYPPDADVLRQNVTAARRLLPYLLPTRLAEAIAAEQATYDACEQYWARD